MLRDRDYEEGAELQRGENNLYRVRELMGQRSKHRQSRSIDLDLTCVTPTLKKVLQWPSTSSPSSLETSIHSGSHPMLLRYMSSLLYSVSTIQPMHVNCLSLDLSSQSPPQENCFQHSKTWYSTHPTLTAYVFFPP